MEENELPATTLLGIILNGMRVLESWVKIQWKEGAINAEKLYPMALLAVQSTVMRSSPLPTLFIA